MVIVFVPVPGGCGTPSKWPKFFMAFVYTWIGDPKTTYEVGIVCLGSEVSSAAEEATIVELRAC